MTRTKNITAQRPTSKNIKRESRFTMPTSRLTKWGNSQGVVIPKRFCDHLGLQVGEELEVSIDTTTRSVTFTCPPQPSRRNQKNIVVG